LSSVLLACSYLSPASQWPSEDYLSKVMLEPNRREPVENDWETKSVSADSLFVYMLEMLGRYLSDRSSSDEQRRFLSEGADEFGDEIPLSSC
jgi:hypothetical protein